jgi:hypothetical protein
MIDDNNLKKGYWYSFVRVDENDDLHWIKAIIYQMQADEQITTEEHKHLFKSLVKQQ